MAKITVNDLITTETKPTITGTVEFNRSKNETINIRLNYVTYDLFGGNLGIKEYIDVVRPTEWILQLDDPISPGVYDIEAYVLDSTGKIIASDESINELTINSIPANQQPKPKRLAEKLQALAALQQAMNILSAGSGASVGGPHPATNDDSSTHLHARGKEESNKSAEERDYQRKKATDAARQDKKPKNKTIKQEGDDPPEPPRRPEELQETAADRADQEEGRAMIENAITSSALENIGAPPVPYFPPSSVPPPGIAPDVGASTTQIGTPTP